MNLAIQAFVSPFQGCFKDGTNGTRDYRALSGGLLALLLLMIVISNCVFRFGEVGAREPVIVVQVTVIMSFCLVCCF